MLNPIYSVSDMKKIINGNFENTAKEHKGWIFGHFINPSSPFHNEDFEIKWGRHPKGQRKEIIGVNDKSKTLCIIIEGQFLLTFPDQKKEILLSKQGDYAYWESGIPHSWFCPVDCLTLTVRWPSVPGDQKIKN